MSFCLAHIYEAGLAIRFLWPHSMCLSFNVPFRQTMTHKSINSGIWLNCALAARHSIGNEQIVTLWPASSLQTITKTNIVLSLTAEKSLSKVIQCWLISGLVGGFQVDPVAYQLSFFSMLKNEMLLIMYYCNCRATVLVLVNMLFDLCALPLAQWSVCYNLGEELTYSISMFYTRQT